MSRSSCAAHRAVADEHPLPSRGQRMLLRQRRERSNQHMKSLVRFDAGRHSRAAHLQGCNPSAARKACARERDSGRSQSASSIAFGITRTTSLLTPRCVQHRGHQRSIRGDDAVGGARRSPNRHAKRPVPQALQRRPRRIRRAEFLEPLRIEHERRTRRRDRNPRSAYPSTLAPSP